MLQLFEPNALELLAQLQQAIHQEDVSAMRNALHTLKGTAKTMGALRLGELAATLEMRVRQHPDSALTQVTTVTVMQLQQLLSEELSELSALMADLMTRHAG